VKGEGMTVKGAYRLEISIIGLGILALVLIFQPFSIMLFAAGAMLVVLAGLLNNLLPLAQPGVPVKTVVMVGLTIAMIFSIVLVISIAAAHLYGVFFLKPPDPNTITGKAALAAAPFYLQPFVWALVAVAVALGLVITWMKKSNA
jgi:hypothetical protein